MGKACVLILECIGDHNRGGRLPFFAERQMALGDHRNASMKFLCSQVRTCARKRSVASDLLPEIIPELVGNF